MISNRKKTKKTNSNFQKSNQINFYTYLANLHVTIAPNKQPHIPHFCNNCVRFESKFFNVSFLNQFVTTS